MHLFVFNLFIARFNYKKGRVFDENNVKLSNKEIKEKLKSNYQALELFETSKVKSGVGGFLIGFGAGLVVSDLAIAFFGTGIYPGKVTYLGAASFVIGIPISIGHGRKLKKSIEKYNQGLQKKTTFVIEESKVFTNQNGVGMKITF